MPTGAVGVDEDMDPVAAIVVLMFGLPFLMAWVERSLDPSPPSPHRRRRPFRRRG